MFRKIYLEITNVCNLSCSFCPKTSRPPAYMNLEQFTQILRKIKGQAERLYFHVLGEPLLHPLLGEFLNLSHTFGYKVTLVTNGTLIAQAAENLQNKPALRQINFSLHSFEANTHSTTIDSYCNAIFAFAKASITQENFMISLRLWNNSVDGKENRNQPMLERIQRVFSLDTLPIDPEKPFAGIKIAKNVFLNQAARFEWPALTAAEIPGRGYCLGLRDQIAILVDGAVVPCCLDSEGIINLGNIFKAELKDIMHNERARKVYEGFSNQEVTEKLCRRCSFRLRFKALED